MKKQLPITEIVKLYFEQQLTLLEIGKRMRVSGTTIRARLIEAGYSVRRRGKAQRKGFTGRFSDAEVAEMERLYCVELCACPEIASRFKCSAGTVRAKLIERGVQLRTYSEAYALRRKNQEETATPLRKETNGKTRSPRTYTPPKRLGKVFDPIPLLPPEQVTPERILQLWQEDELTLDDIAAICSLSRVDIYNILEKAGVT